METKRQSILARAAMTLLFTVLSTVTTWATDWPAYITDIIVVGGSESEVAAAKSAHSDYTFINVNLNEDAGGDIIYLGYKRDNSKSTNGGYITALYLTTKSAGDCSQTLTFGGVEYTRTPCYGGSHFVNDVKGDLNSNAGGKDIHLYYTKNNFSDKRVISDITIIASDNKDVSTPTYYTKLGFNGGTSDCDLNDDAGGDYVYMFFKSDTKTNRPTNDVYAISGLKYTGTSQYLTYSITNHYPGTLKYSLTNNNDFTENRMMAKNVGNYTVYYYADEDNTYGDRSDTYMKEVSIAKSPNSDVTVSCPIIVLGTDPKNFITLSNNLSTGARTYQYSQNSSSGFSTDIPSSTGNWYVKVTIAADNNCKAYTTGAVKFNVVNDYENTASGDSENAPYIISTAEQFELLAQRVNAGTTYSGKFFKLGANITVSSLSSMVGLSETKSFQGTFDGDGRTMTLNLTATADNCAPFAHIKNATIKNLNIAGTITTNKKYSASISSQNYGTSTIQNCASTVEITSTYTSTTEGIHGGFVANSTGAATLNFIGCVFKGKLLGGRAKNNGGFVGYSDGPAYVNYTDCLFAPSQITMSSTGSATFGRSDSNHLSFTRTYYLTAYGTAQGQKALTIGTADGVTVTPSGEATTYNVSGITTYADNQGLSYGDTFYTGATEDVKLTIAYTVPVPDGCTFNGYTDGSGHALTDNGDGTYTLTMPSAAPTVTPVITDHWSVGDGCDGSSEHPYLITTTAGLDLLASNVNGGTTYEGKYFELGADIEYDKAVENNFTPIGIDDNSFSGTFDGKGHTVSGIRIIDTGGTYKAIFGRVNGTVKNLVVSDCRIEAYQDIGGIVALLRGTIENCHVGSDVTLTGNSYVGGIASDIHGGTIKGCTSAATIIGTEAGGMNAQWLGGIAGYASGYVETSPTLTDNLFTGTISGDLLEYIGAIVGNNSCDEPILTNNYHTCSGMGGVGSEGSTTSSDTAGARKAVAIGTADGVTITPTGTAITYNVSGITTYADNQGMIYSNTFYAGATEDVTFTIDYTVPDDCTLIGFTDGNGNALTDNGDDTYTLTVTDAVATITPNLTDSYINMPTTGTRTATIPAGVTSFKVYDDGGASGNYSNYCSGTLVLTAPEGYLLQLSGNIMSELYYDKLTVYDGSDNTGTKLLDEVSSSSSGTKTAIPTVTSTGQSMTLYFSSDNSTNYAGLDLTVTLINLNTEFVITLNTATGGSVSSDKETAKPFETVTLTASPTEGYLLGDISVVDANSHAVDVEWTVWSNTATFTMPTAAVTVTPTFTDDLTSLSINIPKTGTRTATIPSGVTSFKVYDDGGASGNYSNSCHGTLVLTAPEGYVLQLSGNITTETSDRLTVYDSSDNTGTQQLDWVSSSSNGTETVIPTVTSTGQNMTLYFYSDNSTNYAGLDLTVTVINLNTEFVITLNTATGGSVSSDKETAKPFETVTLTASPTEGYLLGDISVVDANSQTVDVEWNAWTNTATFTMPAAAVTVTPTFTDDLTSLSINIPKTGTRTATIPAGVTSFKVYDDGGASGNYSNNCSGTLVLTAPEGYVLQLSGNITTEKWDGLTVYDVSDNTGTKLLDAVSSSSRGTETAIPTVVSTGNSMTLYFYSDYSTNYAGLDLTVTLLKIVELADNADNTSVISDADGDIASVMLTGRTLYRDEWNTLCLPFNATKTGPLAEAVIKELDTETVRNGHKTGVSDGMLYLNFKDAESIVAGRPYIVKWDAITINTEADWNDFAEQVNDGTCSNKIVLLGADISVSTMVGNADHPFSGMFDGCGHTLNVSITDEGNLGTAPFRYIRDATIHNVKVTGTVTGNLHCAGLVGFASGTNSIRQCEVAASVICSGGNHSHCGGILGHGQTSTTTISDCLFSGTISGTTTATGIIYGWGDDGIHTIRNCLADGTYTDCNGIDLLKKYQGTEVVDNCYKTQDIGSRGTYTTTTGSDLVTLLGDGWKVSDENVVPKMNAIGRKIVNPTFNNVTIKGDAPTEFTSDDNVIGFLGTYNVIADIVSNWGSFDALLLGGNNTLNYAPEGTTLGACRAFFLVDPTKVGAGEPDSRLTAYHIDLGNGEILTGMFGSMPGDVDGDSVVDMRDVVAIVNYILGKEVPAGFSEAAADMNGDGKVTISDAVAVVNMLQHQ